MTSVTAIEEFIHLIERGILKYIKTLHLFEENAPTFTKDDENGKRFLLLSTEKLQFATF